MRGIRANVKRVGTAIFATLCVLALVTSAYAVSGDRNHDGISDRWAKRHGLSNKVKQANRDQDHDHVRNLCEYEAGMDPRDRNSDDDRRADGREDADRDGVVNFVESEVETDCDDADSNDDGQDDGDEVSGYVNSFDGEVLKIRMVDGTILSAPLAEGAYIHCERDEYAEKPEYEDPPKDDEDSGDKPEGSIANNGGDYEEGCGVDALVAGTVVKAFYVEDGLFVKVKLIK